MYRFCLHVFALISFEQRAKRQAGPIPQCRVGLASFINSGVTWFITFHKLATTQELPQIKPTLRTTRLRKKVWPGQVWTRNQPTRSKWAWICRYRLDSKAMMGRAFTYHWRKHKAARTRCSSLKHACVRRCTIRKLLRRVKKLIASGINSTKTRSSSSNRRFARTRVLALRVGR